MLAQYLRLAPYGNRIHGIGYAARRYLGKPVEDLSWAEIAFLTAIPQAPADEPYLPRGAPARWRARRRILALLRAAGAIAAPSTTSRRGRSAASCPTAAPAPRGGAARGPAARGALPDPGGPADPPDPPLVRTTLDLDLQEEVSRLTAQPCALSRRGRGKRGGGRAGARHRRDARLGRVRGLLRRPRCRGHRLRRRAPPAGSTLKPFLYALALERGTITPATVLDDGARGPGGVVNADHDYLGPLLPRLALANSRNVPAVALLERRARRGLGPLPRPGSPRRPGPARAYGSGLAVGALPVNLEALVRGQRPSPATACSRAAPGRRPGHPAPRRVLSEDAARQITLFLADPMARLPSFPRMGQRVPVPGGGQDRDLGRLP